VPFEEPDRRRTAAAAPHFQLTHVRQLVRDESNAIEHAHRREDVAAKEQAARRRDTAGKARAIPGSIAGETTFARETFGEARLVDVEVHLRFGRKGKSEAVAQQSCGGLRDHDLVGIRAERRRRAVIERDRRRPIRRGDAGGEREEADDEGDPEGPRVHPTVISRSRR
jgi:hypothetical protein